VNDSNDNWWPEPPKDAEPQEVADATPETSRRRVSRAASSQKAKIAGALLVGGVAGAAILGPLSTLAASPAPTESSAPTSGTGGTGGSSGTTTPTDGDQDQDGHGKGGPGGHNEAVSDTSVVAKAIGISEADLLTALQGGQTVAQVAAAHNVALQVVIDALVADGQAELDAAVKAGTITQAQADAEKTELTQRATDQANGSFKGGGHGKGGLGGPGGHNEAVSDTSVVAKAIGISEADLLTALNGGQTVAQVASAHNVALQVVIDALVADGQAELDAAVKAGTITQAQANAEKTELIQRATDQANGNFQGGGHGKGGLGGHNEAVSDTSVVAKAVGISEADLLTALQGGQTVAQVAAAHNVALQVVIDALVADGQTELDAAVKAGTITQAQADAEKTELTQRATDQANGNFQGGGRH
jgi:hypothetical protein